MFDDLSEIIKNTQIAYLFRPQLVVNVMDPVRDSKLDSNFDDT